MAAASQASVRLSATFVVVALFLVLAAPAVPKTLLASTSRRVHSAGDTDPDGDHKARALLQAVGKDTSNGGDRGGDTSAAGGGGGDENVSTTALSAWANGTNFSVPVTANGYRFGSTGEVRVATAEGGWSNATGMGPMSLCRVGVSLDAQDLTTISPWKVSTPAAITASQASCAFDAVLR